MLAQWVDVGFDMENIMTILDSVDLFELNVGTLS